MKNLDCNIIADLLPLYVDSLTCPESNALIEAHLKDCDECRNSLELLRRELAAAPKPAKPEVDFLKKARNRKRRWMAASLFLSILVFLGVALTQIKITLPNDALHFTKVETVDATINGRVEACYRIVVEYPSVNGVNLQLCPLAEKNDVGIGITTSLFGYLQYILHSQSVQATTLTMQKDHALYFCDKQHQRLIFNDRIDPNSALEPSKISGGSLLFVF